MGNAKVEYMKADIDSIVISLMDLASRFATTGQNRNNSQEDRKEANRKFREIARAVSHLNNARF